MMRLAASLVATGSYLSVTGKRVFNQLKTNRPTTSTLSAGKPEVRSSVNKRCSRTGVASAIRTSLISSRCSSPLIADGMHEDRRQVAVFGLVLGVL